MVALWHLWFNHIPNSNTCLDGDGAISVEELGTIMRAVGHESSDAELLDMINNFDTNGDGKIDFDEFQAMMIGSFANRDGDKELYEAFQTFDKDCNGLISPSELKLLITSLGTPLRSGILTSS